MTLLSPALIGLSAAPASAASVTSLVFTANGGGDSTVTVGGTLYAKKGGGGDLTLTTSSDTKCVDFVGDINDHQNSSSAKTTWKTSWSAPSKGDGVQSVAATASPGGDSRACSGASQPTQAFYVLDNTGPTVTGTTSPAPNAAGWNKGNVTVAWSATDAGSGVKTGPSPSSTTQTAETTGTAQTATASDRLGNTGTGSATVKLDRTPPTITGTRSPVPNASGWNNTDVTASFNCADSLSGIKNCPAPTTLSASGANQSATGTALDNADNPSDATVSGINIDRVAPTLSGAPTTAPNTAGWYRDDVAVRWTASDGLSGLSGAVPADSTISGEGVGLTASAAVTDKAGNSTSATSPAVRIDRTPPTTGITGTSNAWTNNDVTVDLAPSDKLSGVASTSHTIDGGTPASGTRFTLSSEGEHTVTFASTDQAGNAEAPQTAHIRIDKTAPTIGHAFTPLSYADGAWTNQDVTVTFACADAGSGVASCPSAVMADHEGSAQQVVGTATDQAGNAATDTAIVSIDKTAPTVRAGADHGVGPAGWYNSDLDVSFTCDDVLSGVRDCPAARTIGEGADQSVSGTATDTAGNSATTKLSGLNVDATAPALSGAATLAPNQNGWYRDDVPVHWSASDVLSGLDGPAPADSAVTGEGADLSVSTSVADRAGNLATSTVGGIRIDRTAPTTAVDVPPPSESGWYAGKARITLNAGPDLSGVEQTFYSIDSSDPQVYRGPFDVTDSGSHVINYWSTDRAGNIEDRTAPGNSISLAVDGTAPSTEVVDPISPDSGWFVTSGVPFAFRASDQDSGIAATLYSIDGGAPLSYGTPFTETLATGSHTVTYWSVDRVGNAEQAHSFLVRVDTIAPVMTATRTPAANAAGWNNTDVAVVFACADPDSGIAGVAGCSGDATLTNEGANQSVHGDAVDVAGNRSAVDVGPISIDKTPPTLVGVPAAPNAAGWYRSDVPVQWVGDDALSGTDTATQPAASTVTGEGRALTAGPVTIADRAGNVSAPASVSGIRIDRTPPTIAGKPTTAPNAAGWYRDGVVVDFTCADALSGVAACPTSKLLRSDGANQSVTSDGGTDLAGNTATGATVGGINIDGTAPTTTSNNVCTATNGYCTGSTANVVLTATDQPGLSGVKEIHYSIGGGAEQVAAGSTTTVQVPLTGSGAGTVSYWAVDVAGNAEARNSVALKWDNIGPAVTHTVSPQPNAAAWNNSTTTVSFAAKDDDAGSGVASVSPPVTVSAETAGTTVTGTAKDTAGNVGTDSVTVRLDKTAPTITGAIASGSKSASGWYTGPVTVSFTCGDGLSGVAACPDPVVLSASGPNTASGTVTDKAGNTATATVGGILIDQEKPTLTTADVNVQGATYTLGAVPAASCTAVDSYSGLASCKVTVTGGGANGVGTFSYTATATDKAGNASTVTGSYRVIYRWDGFLQPVNDTAHQVGSTTSIFKAGSTVPVKFQLHNAAGAAVASVAAPAWLTPAKGSATTAPVDESVYTVSADSGVDFKYDASTQQYGYNWKAGTGGNYWRIGVTLDDGQTYSTNIGLR